MSGVLKIKVLLFGLVLASPAAARTPPGTLQVPVEIRTKGYAPKVIYVEIPARAVPEPGCLTLLPLAGLLLLRRQRGK